MTSVLEKLQALVDERLDGDPSRLLELFETPEVFRQLRAEQTDADWYHFSPKTFDGQYLIETDGSFVVYQQERGVRFDVSTFHSLAEAAAATFGHPA